MEADEDGCQDVSGTLSTIVGRHSVGDAVYPNQVSRASHEAPHNKRHEDSVLVPFASLGWYLLRSELPAHRTVGKLRVMDVDVIVSRVGHDFLDLSLV
jgi:hypothetical protein